MIEKLDREPYFEDIARQYKLKYPDRRVETTMGPDGTPLMGEDYWQEDFEGAGIAVRKSMNRSRSSKDKSRNGSAKIEEEVANSKKSSSLRRQ